MGFHRGPKIVTDGLVLYVDAANPKSYISGSTTTRSLVGSVTGSLVNGVGFSTGSNGSWVFDGSNDWIDLGLEGANLIQGKTELTMGLFFQSNTNLVLRSLFGTLRYGCGRNLGLVSSFNNLVFYNDYGPPETGTCYPIGFNNYVVPNTWIYAVATYDGTTTKLYGIKQGILSQSTGTGFKSGSTNVFSYNLEIGRGGFGGYLSGNVANAFIYNRVLSQQEVLQNYNATKSRFGL